jgi:HSP20 family protein
MGTQALAKTNGNGRNLSVFDNFFKPWNEWFENDGLLGSAMNVPAVNITESKDKYAVSLAAPGLKKDDFKIAVDGNMLTISSEKEENKEETDKKFTRREYSYSSFSRSFTLPEEINKDSIDAKYEDGVLNITLPRKEEAKAPAAKQIAVK